MNTDKRDVFPHAPSPTITNFLVCIISNPLLSPECGTGHTSVWHLLINSVVPHWPSHFPVSTSISQHNKSATRNVPFRTTKKPSFLSPQRLSRASPTTTTTDKASIQTSSRQLFKNSSTMMFGNALVLSKISTVRRSKGKRGPHEVG